MSKRKKQKDRYSRFLSEGHDISGALSKQEWEIYELVDFFVCERGRLMDLVLEARHQANEVAPWRKPYPEIGEDLFNARFENHPAMNRYYELYEGEPF